MAPKKPKEIIDEIPWRSRIEDAQLDDDSWKVEVVLIEAAGSEQDHIYLKKFEVFAAQKRRFVIKNICKTETMFMINQLGSEKKVKDDNLRVFEEGSAYLKDKKDIPPEIQALIIKHLIMNMKDEYLFVKRQKLEVKEGMSRESATMLGRTEVKDSVSVQPPDPPTPVPSKGKGKKGEKDPSTLNLESNEGKKYNTNLRLRGEEWRDKVYVDDFPTDGPNLYVAITGFNEAYLAGCLTNIGIPLTAVVQIRIDAISTKLPSSLLKTTKRGPSQTEVLAEKSLKFWENLQQLRIHREFTDDFKNTAFIVFSPPYWDSESLSGSPDKIYDEICYLLYDIQDLKRQHAHYLDNMDIKHIPVELCEHPLQKYYDQQIDELPLECVTTYSVLDGILQAVCKSDELEESESKISSLSAAITINKAVRISPTDDKIGAENFVKEVFNTLCKTDAERKAYRMTYGDDYENLKDPIVIHYGDLAKYPTFHLGNINLDNVVRSTLFSMPINLLWFNQNRPAEMLEAKINFHVNVLLSCFDRKGVETAELNRLIHILACRKLYNNRSSLKKRHLPSMPITEFKKIYLKRSVLAEPLQKCPSLFRCSSSMSRSFPSMTKSENASDNISQGDLSEDSEGRRIKFLFDCPDLSELVSAAEIANGQPVNHMIDNFEFFEEFTGTCAFQVLFDAFNKFNCVDYKYCEVTDCFVLMFFNSHDKEGIAREEWRSHLPTPLCLQDFFDYVLEENYGWIQNEENIYDRKTAMRSHSESKDLTDPVVMQSCLEDTNVEMDLLMDGSLKHRDTVIVQEATVEIRLDKLQKSSKKSTVSPTSIDVESNSSRNVTATPKNLKTYLAPQNGSVSSILIHKKPFLGYNLSDRRVEVFGKDSTYFSKDGTKVSSLYTLLIPMNLEYVVLNITPGSGNNEFWLHKSLGEFVPIEVVDACESFRINSKDEVMINIKKQSYEVLLEGIETPKSKQTKSASPKLSQVQTFETKYYHSLYVTWPNGLITESVHKNNGPEISYIKQYFTSLNPNLDETKRCISPNGEVIIFKTSGDIQILRPDGTYINITKCERRLVVRPIIEEDRSDSTPDKNKKGKLKEKTKDSVKSFKNVDDDDKNPEVKLSEYELFVEEFEIIEENGLRQIWVNDTCIKTEKLMVRTATDFSSGEIFMRKMSGCYYSLLNNGAQVFTFGDSTRIITDYVIEEEEIFPEWTDEEKEYFEMIESETLLDTDTNKSKASSSQKSNLYSGSVASSSSKKSEEEEIKEKIKERTDGFVSVWIMYTIEHANFTTITINKGEGKFIVESPNNTKVVIDNNIHYDIILDDETSAKFNGQVLHINFEACHKCKSYTTCDIQVMKNKNDSITNIYKNNWLKMKDSFCKKIVVNEEGNISLTDEPCSQDTLQGEETYHEEHVNNDNSEAKTEVNTENSSTNHGQCGNIYQAKTMRFFVLRRELTCSELVHRALVEQYKCACRWLPWCTINQYDTFGDHRTLLSMLTPVHLTETEKWLMDSKLADKPKYLSYKDLREDCGKGFYHWMRAYERHVPKIRKPDNVIPPKQPKAFVLRTLEQQWNEDAREKLKGAKELLAAIIRYRAVMQSDCASLLHVPVIDPREEDERHMDDIIHALAHRIYEDLKARLKEDMQCQPKATITTKPLPVMEEMSVEGEMVEEVDEIKALEEERASLLKELEEASKMSPNLEKYWRRREEDLKEEKFYQYLLREGTVPPYFRNVLGGAIWSEMSDNTDEAIMKAEKRKMTCVCATKEGAARSDIFTLPPLI